jgi:hypothetical protein
MSTEPQFIITHAVTADSFDGYPWPPSSTDTWHVVRRLSHNFTLWRSIQIAQSVPPSTDAQSDLDGKRTCN